MFNLFIQSKITHIHTLLQGINQSGNVPEVIFCVQDPLNRGSQKFFPGVHFSGPVETDSKGCITMDLSGVPVDGMSMGSVVSGKAPFAGILVEFKIPMFYITSIRLSGTPLQARFEVIVPFVSEDDLQNMQAPYATPIH